MTVINALHRFECRRVDVNAQRVADKILKHQKFHSELEKRIKSGDFRERDWKGRNPEDAA